MATQESLVTDSFVRLLQLVRRINNYFAVVDAMGKLESGYLEGNMQWLGSFDECQNVTVPYPHPHDNSSNQTVPTGNKFEGMPCTATLRNPTNVSGCLSYINMILSVKIH